MPASFRWTDVRTSTRRFGSGSGIPAAAGRGDTLVVETINVTQINQRALGIFGANESARLVERFTRTGEHSIDYELTVTDPAEYTRPWTASIPMTTLEGGIYEYACHEGQLRTGEHPAGRARPGGGRQPVSMRRGR